MIAAHRIPGSDPDLRQALLAADLPIDDIDDFGREFFRVESDGRLLGYGGFEVYGDDALIRSIVVPKADRSRGYGRLVTEAVLDRIANAGARKAYLLTTTAAAFFEHLGFDRVDRSEAPASVLGTRQASSICSSADMFSRTV